MKQKMNKWISVNDRIPPNGIPVKTKIDDGKGIRNESILIRKNNLWFLVDGSMYVYYTPTHWMPYIPQMKGGAE